MSEHEPDATYGPHAAAYRGAMERITDLATAIDDDTAERLVPATPEWRVRELLAHIVGVPSDVLAGRVEGAATDAWTAAQVEARRGRSVTELLAEWRSSWPGFSGVLGAFAERGPAPVLVFDVLSHEQDLRAALDRPGARDTGTWTLPWAMAVKVVGRVRDTEQAGALVLEATDREPAVAGTGEATATVRAPAFELLRAVTGRRSEAQIRAWDWQGDCVPGHLCMFPARSTDLVE